MNDPILMAPCPHYKKYHCYWQMFETRPQWFQMQPPHTPNSPWRLLWGSRATTFLLMPHYCRLSATYTAGISAPFIPSLNGIINFCLSYHLPFLSLWRLLIYSKTDQIPFLSALPSGSSLAIGLLPGNQNLAVSPAASPSILTQHSQQCFRFPFFTFFSKPASCRFLLLMFVYLTAYKQLRSDSQFP